MKRDRNDARMPTDVSSTVGPFDRFAGLSARFFSKPWFFAVCVAMVVVWAPSFLVIPSADTWQLIINTTTTIVTFLMVALLQNTQTRQDQATQDKLNAIAETLADLARERRDGSTDGDSRRELGDDADQSDAAVGVEEHEST